MPTFVICDGCRKSGQFPAHKPEDMVQFTLMSKPKLLCSACAGSLNAAEPIDSCSVCGTVVNDGQLTQAENKRSALTLEDMNASTGMTAWLCPDCVAHVGS